MVTITLILNLILKKMKKGKQCTMILNGPKRGNAFIVKYIRKLWRKGTVIGQF